MLTIAGTGHRPNKLGGYSERIHSRLTALATAALRLQPDVPHVISGMALGWDTALAQAALDLGLKLTAAVPFAGQERTWPAESQARYHNLLGRATEVVTVSDGGYSARAMQLRNQWMVDQASLVLALWDGSHGGTGNCIRYAQSVNCPIRNVWTSWVKHRGW